MFDWLEPSNIGLGIFTPTWGILFAKIWGLLIAKNWGFSVSDYNCRVRSLMVGPDRILPPRIPIKISGAPFLCGLVCPVPQPGSFGQAPGRRVQRQADGCQDQCGSATGRGITLPGAGHTCPDGVQKGQCCVAELRCYALRPAAGRSIRSSWPSLSRDAGTLVQDFRRSVSPCFRIPGESGGQAGIRESLENLP